MLQQLLEHNCHEGQSHWRMSVKHDSLHRNDDLAFMGMENESKPSQSLPSEKERAVMEHPCPCPGLNDQLALYNELHYLRAFFIMHTHTLATLSD